MSSNRARDEFKERVKQSVNLVEVVGQHVLLKKVGSNYTGLCPFHQERSPSFSVSETKQFFHCFGCKAGGDVFEFITKLHGVSFVEALEEMAERAKLEMPSAQYASEASLSPADRAAIEAKRQKTQLQYKLTRFVAKYYHDHLARDPRTEAYLRSRGVDEETQRAFYLGSTPAGWSPLSKRLLDAKAPIELARELGLVRESTKAPTGAGTVPYFDLFRDRVLFPILDVRGKVVGFGGRALTKTADGPKYLNSTESALFQKSKTLYGLYQSQKAIRAEDVVIVVEGYFDYLALYSAGFQNVVATCGTALTADHLKVLKRFASKIILLFDSDAAGRSATIRSMELALGLGIVLYGGELPIGRDVDEILYPPVAPPLPAVANAPVEVPAPPPPPAVLSDAGRAKVETLLKAAPSILDREIDRAVSEAGEDMERKSIALKQIGEWLGSFHDEVGREMRIEKVCRDLGVSRAVLQRAAAVSANPNSVHAHPAPNAGPAIRMAGGGNPGSGNASNGNQSMSSVSAPRIAALGPVSPPAGLSANRSNDPPSGTPTGPSRGPSNQGPGGPVAAPVARSTPPARKLPVTALDRGLLRGALRGGEFLEMLREASDHLPEGGTLEELVQHPDMRRLFARTLAGERPAPDWEDDLSESAPRTFLREELLEIGREPPPKGTPAEGAPFGLKDFQIVVRKGLQKEWARFSQRFKLELTVDGDLTRSQEWLDVQNKIKELGNFYDQNE